MQSWRAKTGPANGRTGAGTKTRSDKTKTHRTCRARQCWTWQCRVSPCWARRRPSLSILSKPVDAADAVRMLRRLSGRSHRVITGVALKTAEHTEVAAEVTGVTFLTLSDAEIEAYVATGEPMDKAGAYAVQGGAARWIPRIEGCYFNVMGLPVALVCALLEGRGADRRDAGR